MTEIFTKIIENRLTPNTFYVLYCIKENIIPDKFINKELECTRLKNDLWITNNLELTSKSIIFIAEIDGYFKKSKKLTSKELMGDNFMLNIQAYVNIFPNKKLSSGKYARVPAKSLENSFRWFFDTYNFDWQIIFSATQKYISEYESKDYEYMRNSQYFLRKQNIDKSWDSDLATYCEYLSNDPEEENENYCELIV
jgi:hypothetical protein